MHKIVLEDIKIFAHHGLYDNEIKSGQDFYITIEYKQQYLEQIDNDKIFDVIDYSTVINDVKNKFVERRYNLIECVAKDLFDYLFDKYKFPYLKLIVKKSNVKLNISIKSIYIEIEDEQ